MLISGGETAAAAANCFKAKRYCDIYCARILWLVCLPAASVMYLISLACLVLICGLNAIPIPGFAMCRVLSVLLIVHRNV